MGNTLFFEIASIFVICIVLILAAFYAPIVNRYMDRNEVSGTTKWSSIISECFNILLVIVWIFVYDSAFATPVLVLAACSAIVSIVFAFIHYREKLYTRAAVMLIEALCLIAGFVLALTWR